MASGGLDPSPELDESPLLIYKSHQNVNQQLATIMTILDRLLLATQGRYQAVNDLAREVRFRYFDEPRFQQAMNKVYEEMQAHLAYLSEHPLALDCDERIRQLVDCPQPLQNLLTSRFPRSNDQVCQIMLEVLTRRYYRIDSTNNGVHAGGYHARSSHTSLLSHPLAGELRVLHYSWANVCEGCLRLPGSKHHRCDDICQV
jgi:hypothetical protein